jgi:hypothetical protein
MEKRDDWHYTGVLMTPEEIEHVMAARDLPRLVVGGHVTESIEERIHRMALKHGLPDIRGHYGALATGEFVCLKDALESEPDSWPSRNLADMVDK